MVAVLVVTGTVRRLLSRSLWLFVVARGAFGFFSFLLARGSDGKTLQYSVLQKSNFKHNYLGNYANALLMDGGCITKSLLRVAFQRQKTKVSDYFIFAVAAVVVGASL